MPKAAQHHALARQWQVLRLLPTKPPGITSRELVEKLEREGFTVTKRTVERDLAELSTIFGIACNDKGMPYGWHWMKGEYADLPGLTVSDAVSLRLVEDLLRPLLPSAMLESLEARFGQAKAKLAELSADNPNAKWTEKVRYVSPSMPFLPPQIDSAVLDAVHNAMLNEHQIEVEYGKAAGEQKTYRLHPLALVQRGQITYLVATAFDYEDGLAEKVFLFQANEIYVGGNDRDVCCITRGEMNDFLTESLSWLPGIFKKKLDLISAQTDSGIR